MRTRCTWHGCDQLADVIAELRFHGTKGVVVERSVLCSAHAAESRRLIGGRLSWTERPVRGE